MDPPTCLVTGCDAVKLFARGFCCAHYKRLRKYGDPLAGRTRTGDARRAFYDLLLIETDDCILWPYAKGNGGYGVVGIHGGVRGTHVIACEAWWGEAPSPSHQVAHSCRNPSCMNHRHLRWATPVENHADMMIHGTRPVGEDSHFAKLTTLQVLEIRRRSSERSADLAREFNVGYHCIYEIINRKSWAWLA